MLTLSTRSLNRRKTSKKNAALVFAVTAIVFPFKSLL